MTESLICLESVESVVNAGAVEDSFCGSGCLEGIRVSPKILELRVATLPLSLNVADFSAFSLRRVDRRKFGTLGAHLCSRHVGPDAGEPVKLHH